MNVNIDINALVDDFANEVMSKRGRHFQHLVKTLEDDSNAPPELIKKILLLPMDKIRTLNRILQCGPGGRE